MPADVAPETRRYYQQLTRFSAALAFLADISMGVLGGALKRKEKLSARLGDVLSMLYLCSATLKRYEDEGRQAEDAPLMHWAIWDAMFRAQNAIEGVISNFPSRTISALLRAWSFRWVGRMSCLRTSSATRWRGLLIEPSATRDRLTAGHVSAGRRGRRDWVRSSLRSRPRSPPSRSRPGCATPSRPAASPLRPAPTAAPPRSRPGVITADELRLLRRASELADRVIRVDDFAQDLGASELQTVDRRRAREHSRPQGRSRMKRLATETDDFNDEAAMTEPVYVVDGTRTPFLKARNRPGPFAASDLAVQAGRGVADAHAVRARASSTK